MKNRFYRCILMACIFVAVVVFPVYANTPNSMTKRDEIYQQLCHVREMNNLPPLAIDRKLEAAASIRAKETASFKTPELLLAYGHTRPNGQDFWTVDESVVFAENLAYGYHDADVVMTEWIKSPKHRKFVFTEKYKAVGIAVWEENDGRIGWAMELGFGQ